MLVGDFTVVEDVRVVLSRSADGRYALEVRTPDGGEVEMTVDHLQVITSILAHTVAQNCREGYEFALEHICREATKVRAAQASGG